jgi:hypothetical protein
MANPYATGASPAPRPPAVSPYGGSGFAPSPYAAGPHRSPGMPFQSPAPYGGPPPARNMGPCASPGGYQPAYGSPGQPYYSPAPR